MKNKAGVDNWDKCGRIFCNIQTKEVVTIKWWDMISRSLFICLLIYCKVILLKQTIMSKVETFFMYLTEEIINFSTLIDSLSFSGSDGNFASSKIFIERASDWVQELKW